MPMLQTKKVFFEKNPVLEDFAVNLTFEELLDLDDAGYEAWMILLRKRMLAAWDTYGCPPRSGRTEDEMIRSFNELPTFPAATMIHTDELNAEHGVDAVNDVILNVARKGTEVDQFFPTMMKARINYTAKDTGYSIYDMFAQEKFLPRMLKGGQRHFLRDSFFHYSLCVRPKDTMNNKLVAVKSASKWFEAFQNKQISRGYDFWLHEVPEQKGVSSGYHQVEQTDFLFFSADEVASLAASGRLTSRQVRNLDLKDLKKDHRYMIRLFKLGQHIFPKAFIAFKIGYIQVAVNFPPMTAKYLYERFTNHCQDRIGVDVTEPIVLYDPSSGWGGRILGALSVKDDRRIHYVGVDPNTECWDLEDGSSRYEAVARFFVDRTYRGNALIADNPPATVELFQDGSECVHLDPRFQKYKGKFDLVFTSPPYFNREAYGEDPKQSYKKFPQYESWREGYLRQTLKTCVEYLKPGSYLLWNIADLLHGKEYLPLQADSQAILESLGMVRGSQAPGVYKQPDVIKMAMQSMPGQNRLNEDGTPKVKNFAKVDGTYYKYEPVFVWYKPVAK